MKGNGFGIGFAMEWSLVPDLGCIGMHAVRKLLGEVRFLSTSLMRARF
jgi:hypothetical protein